MSSKTKTILVGGGFLGLICVGLLAGWMFVGVESHDPIDRESALVTARAWARLAPLPARDEDVSVKTHGSMFTREFVIRFHAPPSKVERWLTLSPGTRRATVDERDDGWTRYAIRPADGASFAEVVVSPEKDRVKIRTYWQ